MEAFHFKEKFYNRNMKLICFLRNIGNEYEKTRHNAGFLCGDFLQKKLNFSAWKFEKKFFGAISTGHIDGEKYIFLKPHTFMNLSGKSLLAVMQFYKIDIVDICIIYDDKDIILGKIRKREKGSSGGQNGIKDIIRVLGTQEFKRIKIGVGNEKQAYFNNAADFVLSSFSQTELKELNDNIFFEVEGMVKSVFG